MPPQAKINYTCRKPPDVSGAGLLVRGPPLSPGVVRGVGTTSRDPLPRAPLSVGASAAEWDGFILDGKRVDLQSGAPGQAGPGSGPCRARLGPVPGPARAPCPPGPGPRALPGPACHSRAEAPKSAGRGARRARRGENRPGKSTLGGPGAATFDPAGARRCPCRARNRPRPGPPHLRPGPQLYPAAS